MPNWCENNMTISHDDPKMLEKALEAWNNGKFLQTLIPCPQPLIDTVAGSVGRLGDDPLVNYRVELHEAQMALNEKYFGHKDWYSWCVAEWGTKWDIGSDEAEYNQAKIENGAIWVRFNSAWSPPTGAYEKLSAMGYRITAYYYEPGCDFCGEWIEGQEETFSIRNAPKRIDEMFGISEWLEETEE
jgi:hypothetical protein